MEGDFANVSIAKRQHVKVLTRYWSVVNESDDKQTKSISNRSNPFSEKTFTITIHYKQITK